jgi:hypothetical protein
MYEGSLATPTQRLSSRTTNSRRNAKRCKRDWLRWSKRAGPDSTSRGVWYVYSGQADRLSPHMRRPFLRDSHWRKVTKPTSLLLPSKPLCRIAVVPHRHVRAVRPQGGRTMAAKKPGLRLATIREIRTKVHQYWQGFSVRNRLNSHSSHRSAANASGSIETTLSAPIRRTTK